ncbi:MAG: nuclear transport factor 2 family protein [Caulobacteraceae bacterium]|nr:nuclear transport factor 2 family protein [Caulobacter sp.]RYF92771.1 MAG: nuclear transport factor 2 family protein [Caulobacteraceae bacterium]
MDARRTLLLRFYKALDTRDAGAIAAMLHPEADFPDQIDGGRVVGAAAVLAYFVRAFALIRTENALTAFSADGADRLRVRIHHHVTSVGGALWHDGSLDYRFTFRDGRIVRMDRIDD